MILGYNSVMPSEVLKLSPVTFDNFLEKTAGTERNKGSRDQCYEMGTTLSSQTDKSQGKTDYGPVFERFDKPSLSNMKREYGEYCTTGSALTKSSRVYPSLKIHKPSGSILTIVKGHFE